MSSFHERQKNLFEHLKDAEDQCGFSKSNKATDVQDYGVVDKRTYRKLKHEMKQFRGRESIYKREGANIKQCLKNRTIPDHIKNPKKWVYYSLSDVTPDQMSDSTNTATALAFIREMEARDAKLKIDHPDMDETGLFKKPTFQFSKTIKQEKNDEKATFKSSKVIMPEYIVGVTKQKKEKKMVPKKEETESENVKKVELKLNHLYDDDYDN